MRSKDPLRLDQNNFHLICDELASRDEHLAQVLQRYGYPPLWTRRPCFATLIHIILEQQVSLDSAKAAFLKLKTKIGLITPARLLNLTDEELKACYFSRQKIVYSKELAKAVISKELSFKKIKQLPAEEIRHVLKKIKGIGDWTADIFLMMCIAESDVFPSGDIALIKSVKEVKGLPPHTSPQEIMLIAEKWKPYRTAAAFLLYHAYLTKRNRFG